MAAKTEWRATTALATVRVMLIRRETPADIDAIRTVTNLAFKNGPEAQLIDWLWPLWDDENRALHDFIVNTRTVKA